MKDDYVRICPQCNSTHTEIDTSNAAIARLAMITFSCSNCGHKGPMFPEINKKELPPLKNPRKPNLVNVQYGININWLWRWLGPVLFIIGIVFVIQRNNPFLFYLGLIELLPLSVVITLSAYNKRLRKHKAFRVVFIIVLIYFLLTVGFLPFYLSGMSWQPFA